VSKERDPDITDRNLYTDYQILLIFGTNIFDPNIFDQLAIKQLFKFLPHRMSVSALPGKNRSSEICIERNKKHQ